jgi:hypothetical protein
MLRLIAMAMVQPTNTPTGKMAAHACASTSIMATIVGLHRLAMPQCIAQNMEQRLTWTTPMAASALARLVSMGTIVPFHQLVTATFIATGIPRSTWIVQMDAYATVLAGGLATIARLRQRAIPNLIATAMA